jgi:ribosomal protein S18 acetylase RimI-like enzyme
MIQRDMPDILSTESYLAEPWSENAILGRLRHRHCIGLVVEAGDRVVGHAIYELHKRKLVLTRMAVHPIHRRCGVGRALMTKLLNKLGTHRRPFLVVKVDERDLLTTCQFLKQFNPARVGLADGRVRFVFRADV